jgi:uncharacterized iron-regulated membrane protein
MLLLCLTGLPLIYHHEIGHLLGNEVEAPALPAELAESAARQPRRRDRRRQGAYPDKIMMYMSQEADEPAIWFLTMGDAPNDPALRLDRGRRAHRAR